MNDTNNNPVVNNTSGVPNAVPASAPTEATTTPAAPIQATEAAPAVNPAAPDNTNQTQVQPANNTQEPIKEDNKKDETGQKEFPYAAVTIGIALILIAFAYYFLYITPTRVLDEAIEDIFMNINNVASSVTNPSKDSMVVDLKGKLRTKGRELEGLKDVAFLDNLQVEASIDANLKDLDFGVSIVSDSKETTGMKYPNDINLTVDYIDDDFYLELGDKLAKYQSTNNLTNKLSINNERINDALAVFESMKDQVVDIIQEDQLSKKLTTKKVNNQTAIAIKAHVKLDNEDIAAIYYEGFGNLVKNEKFVKQWANVFAITEKEAELMLQGINDRKVLTDNIEVNLYMNLANTELIGLDVTVGNFYFELTALNGFYYIDFKFIDDKGNEALDIEVEYDTFLGVLNGVGTVDIQTSYLIVEFDYTRITSGDSNVMVGNTLDFKFYDDENGKPFATLDCTLDLSYDKEMNLADVNKAISFIELSDAEIKGLINTTDKVTYEILFIVKKLMLNRLGALADPAVDKIEVTVNDMVEKEIINMVEAYLKEMPPQQLAVMLGSPQGQQSLIQKISFMSPENQMEVMNRVGKLKEQLMSK